jgi:hypothetical protein
MIRRLLVGLVFLSLVSLIIGNAWSEILYTVTDLGTVLGGIGGAAHTA